MICKLTNGDTIFTFADGVGRLYQSLERADVDMDQDTQEEDLMRGSFPVAYPDRSSRSFTFELPVTYPANASLDDAFIQAHDMLAQCPRGGALSMQVGSKLRTYSQAWVKKIKAKPMGLTNLFVFTIKAVNPNSTTLSILAAMDSRYVANLSAITGLTGGGSTNMDGLPTADVAPGFMAFCTPTIGGFAQPKHFKLTAGATAQNLDPTAGPLKVRPLDYDGTTNLKFWIEN